MKIGFLIGRVIVGAYFLYSASHHFLDNAALAAYAASKGVPLARLAVAGTGLLLVIGGISFLLGWQPRVGIAAVVLFFLGVTPMMHNFWAVEAAQKSMQLVNFTKNAALLGSALMFLAIPVPWPVSLGRARKK
jgi:putative oxidoreductase